ncbi:MAG: hypothetical protein HPZ91_07375 [Lentisphaeria bacterium]|nr:hypothetical protein [Lentisphaeria bacterium]
MNPYITFFVLWIVSLLVWFGSLWMRGGYAKNILGYTAIFVEFISGTTIAPAIFSLWKTDSIIKDTLYLLFVFAPLFFMIKFFANSKKKERKKENLQEVNQSLSSSGVKNDIKEQVHLPKEFFPLSSADKIMLCFMFVSLVLLGFALFDGFFHHGYRDGFPSGYYVFTKIIIAISFVWLSIKQFSPYLKFVFFLVIILYNPIIPIHFGDRQIWILINTATIFLLLTSLILYFRHRSYASQEQSFSDQAGMR